MLPPPLLLLTCAVPKCLIIQNMLQDYFTGSIKMCHEQLSRATQCRKHHIQTLFNQLVRTGILCT